MTKYNNATAITLNGARRLLPNVGDRRTEVPTIAGVPDDNRPRRCVVTEVNAPHLWYRVRFLDSGFYECFKVPELRRAGNGYKEA